MYKWPWSLWATTIQYKIISGCRYISEYRCCHKYICLLYWPWPIRKQRINQLIPHNILQSHSIIPQFPHNRPASAHDRLPNISKILKIIPHCAPTNRPTNRIRSRPTLRNRVDDLRHVTQDKHITVFTTQLKMEPCIDVCVRLWAFG